MDEIIALIKGWKEVGALAIIIILLFKLLTLLVTWLLEFLNVKVKRRQSRDDLLESRVDNLESRMARVEAAYRTSYHIAHDAADAIETEMKKSKLENSTFDFIVKQLRSIRDLEEVVA